jgi:hypothetical protein
LIKLAGGVAEETVLGVVGIGSWTNDYKTAHTVLEQVVARQSDEDEQQYADRPSNQVALVRVRATEIRRPHHRIMHIRFPTT